MRLRRAPFYPLNYKGPTTLRFTSELRRAGWYPIITACSSEARRHEERRRATRAQNNNKAFGAFGQLHFWRAGDRFVWGAPRPPSLLATGRKKIISGRSPVA